MRKIKIHKIHIILLFTLVACCAGLQARGAQAHELLARVDSFYSCVDMKEARLRTFRGSRRALNPFMERLDNVIERKQGTVNIWHVGGSHVQAGIFSHRMRRNFALYLNGGVASRTILFPYKLVNTNGPTDYSVSGTGRWSRSRNIERSPSYEMGLTGITAVTSTPGASITFSMSRSGDIDWTTRYIRVLGKGSDGVRPYVVVDSVEIEDFEGNNEQGYFFEVPQGCNTFTIKFHGLGGGNRFEFRGAIALNGLPGVSYWASGINGAATASWLRCDKLEQDLSVAKPDMVIFGIGINDAHTSHFNRDRFKENYQQLIDKIKRVNPDCQFIFVTNNDNLFRSNVNPNTRGVEKVFIELALDNNGSVWDLYRVMGGYGGSKKWVRNSLMQSDHVHFTKAGYKLIGDLLYNAIMEQYLKWKE